MTSLVVELTSRAPVAGGIRAAGAAARAGSQDVVIEGSVRRDGEPAAGAYVRLLDCSGELRAEVVSGAQGQFRFHARPGVWTLRALAAGARGARTVRVTRARIHLDLTLGVAPSGQSADVGSSVGRFGTDWSRTAVRRPGHPH